MKVIKEDDLDKAIESLNKGNLIIFPTETVYGLGANALDSLAVDKIFAAKNRQSNNPLIVHLKNKEEINKYAIINNDVERKLINYFMPGPFTLILQKKDLIPSNVTCQLDTVGIRVPIDKIAHKLLEKLSFPIAAPSANKSTKPSGTNVLDIIDDFTDSVDYIIDGGDSLIGLESTVVKVIDNIPTILRPGFITKEDIEEVIGKCHVSEYLFKKADGQVESPGMLYKHYAPKTECILCDKEIINDFIDTTKKVIVIGHNLNITCYKYYDYGKTFEDIAHNIFKLLRQADKDKADLIIIEATSIKSLGLAIMNRLIRTCNYNYKRYNENS